MVTNEFRRKRRPLKASEIERISHGMVENLDDSVLSLVMIPADYQYITQSQRGSNHYSQPLVSRRIMLRSLVESKHSMTSANSNNGVVIQDPYQEV